MLIVLRPLPTRICRVDLFCFYSVACNFSLRIRNTNLLEKHCDGTSSNTRMRWSFACDVTFKNKSELKIRCKSILIAGAGISFTPNITFIPLRLGLVNLVCKDAISTWRHYEEHSFLSWLDPRGNWDDWQCQGGANSGCHLSVW